MLAQKFSGPTMFVAAAEETGEDLFSGRGDAYCGMLNASYNIGLRKLNPYIPEYPVGTAEEIAKMILDFQNLTRGTIEGNIVPGNITLFRLQSTADCELRSYIAQGEVLDINPKSFGGIGVFVVKEMARFYRYILIGKGFPHHTDSIKHTGKVLFETMKMFDVGYIAFNQPPNLPYRGENIFFKF